MADLKKLYQYYTSHKNELLKEYLNRFLVIKDNQIIGDYNSQEEAYKETIKTHEPWTFIIQHCVEKEDVVVYHSRVSF